jgi:hypothetical protein
MSDDRSSSPEPPKPADDLPDMFEAHITGRPDAVRQVTQRFDLDVGCRHAHFSQNKDGTVTLLAFATEERIREIEEAGYAVRRGENVSALGRERQAEVGRNDRFEGGKNRPEGLGRLDNDQERPAT